MNTEPYFFTIRPNHINGLFHVIFATRVVSIPDLSSYEQMENLDDVERLRQVINVQKLLLLELNIQPDSENGLRAFEIRYIWVQKKLSVVILGKGTSHTEQNAFKLANELWVDLNKLFPQEYYRGGLLSIRTKNEFEEVYQPFLFETAGIVALEKQVEIYRLLRTKEDYAVPYPYHWGISSMAGLCKALTRQERPHVVSIALMPWVLTDMEIDAINAVAGVLKKAGEGREKSLRMGTASTLASGNQSVSNRDSVGQANRENFMPDPQAKQTAEVFEQYLQNLARPLIFRPYIAAEGPVDPSVVGALQAEIIGFIPPSNDPAKETILPRIPRERWFSGIPLDKARTDLLSMDIQGLVDGAYDSMDKLDGDLGEYYQKLNRLPYLVDVQEASCAFRLPALPRRDEIGLPVHSGAFISLDQGKVSEPSFPLGLRDNGKQHFIHLNDLSKHVLVVGTTGSGKTTTCLHLLSELAKNKVPFLVIEPVNAEHNDYRALLRLPELSNSLQIFTLGDESVSPFRLNPFEIQPGITVNEHISSLLTAFKAAIPMWEPLPRIFLKALNRVYFRLGWTSFKKPSGLPGEPLFPNMAMFYKELSQVVDNEIEHEGEVKSNIRGASKLRIEALLEGSCGRTISATRSLPIATWMEQPTILELKHIGDDEDKALLMAFVLMSMNEYLEKGRSRTEKGKLKHVTLIEEAHRLLENSSEQSSPDKANTKGQAAQAFARALAENRKYGESIIIAEQLPTKLVPDVIGNTALKIMHRLTSAEDREVMGKAMKFNEFQQEHVAMLRMGEAAVYGIDLDEPSILHTPNFWAEWESKGISVDNNPVSDQELTSIMAGYRKKYMNLFVPFQACKLCPALCTGRDIGEGLMYDKSLNLAGNFTKLCADLDTEDSLRDIFNTLMSFCSAAIHQSAGQFATDARTTHTAEYCLFLHLKDQSGLFSPDGNFLWEEQFRLVQESGNK